MSGCGLQFIDEIAVELLLANECEETARLLAVGLVEPGARANDRLPEGHDVMPVVEIPRAEAPRDDWICVDFDSFIGCFLEESQPALLCRNELNVFVLDVSLLPVHLLFS